MENEPIAVMPPEFNGVSAEPKAPVPRNFFSLSLADLELLFKSYGKEKFRAQQIYKWV